MSGIVRPLVCTPTEVCCSEGSSRPFPSPGGKRVPADVVPGSGEPAGWCRRTRSFAPVTGPGVGGNSALTDVPSPPEHVPEKWKPVFRKGHATIKRSRGRRLRGRLRWHVRMRGRRRTPHRMLLLHFRAALSRKGRGHTSASPELGNRLRKAVQALGRAVGLDQIIVAHP
jgi:hypothetical protein